MTDIVPLGLLFPFKFLFKGRANGGRTSVILHAVVFEK